MGSAKYIGRVGGLAVALGVGMAIASTPGVAWADDTSSASSAQTPGPGDATAGGASESEGTSTSTQTTGASTVAGSQTNGASAPGSASVDTSELGTSASTGASVRQVPPGTAMSTGGADKSTTSNSETSANGDMVVESTTDDTTLPEPVAGSTATDSEAPAAVTAPLGGSNRQQRLDESTGASGVEGDALTATGNSLPSRPAVSPPPRTAADVAVHQPATLRPVTVVTDRTYLPSQASFVAHAVSAARTEPTEPRNKVSAVVWAALATAGLGPLAPNDPLTPVNSPLELALLAVGARPRPFGQAVKEEAGKPSR